VKDLDRLKITQNSHYSVPARSHPGPLWQSGGLDDSEYWIAARLLNAMRG
jgi:hypothetical protein